MTSAFSAQILVSSSSSGTAGTKEYIDTIQSAIKDPDRQLQVPAAAIHNKDNERILDVIIGPINDVHDYRMALLDLSMVFLIAEMHSFHFITALTDGYLVVVSVPSDDVYGCMLLDDQGVPRPANDETEAAMKDIDLDLLQLFDNFRNIEVPSGTSIGDDVIATLQQRGHTVEVHLPIHHSLQAFLNQGTSLWTSC